MTERDLRNIFSRFENLNLIVLIEDIKRGFVAKGGWITRFDWQRNLCPIAHGTDCHTTLMDGRVYRESASKLGITFKDVLNFTTWWDNGCHGEDLLTVLQDILRERLEDAEAVEDVLKEEAPCSV